MPSAESPESVYLVFGRRLKTLRDKCGMAQHELAIRSGLTRASIANIESGRQRVLLHQILQFADALNVEIGQLVPTKPEVETELQNVEMSSIANYLQRLTEALKGLDVTKTADDGKEKDISEEDRRRSAKGVRYNRASNRSSKDYTKVQNTKSKSARK